MAAALNPWDGESFYRAFREFGARSLHSCPERGCGDLATVVHTYATELFTELQNQIDGRAWEEASRPMEDKWGEKNRDSETGSVAFELAFLNLTDLDRHAPPEEAIENMVSAGIATEVVIRPSGDFYVPDEKAFNLSGLLFTRLSMTAKKGNAFAAQILSVAALNSKFEHATQFAIEDALLRSSKLDADLSAKMKDDPGLSAQDALRHICEA